MMIKEGWFNVLDLPLAEVTIGRKRCCRAWRSGMRKAKCSVVMMAPPIA